MNTSEKTDNPLFPMSNKYPADWDERRRRVYTRDGYTCQRCGAEGGKTGNTELHAHHRIPVSQGGSHDLSNLITLCRSCHNKQHGHDITAQQPSASADSGQYFDRVVKLLGSHVFGPIFAIFMYLIVSLYGFSELPIDGTIALAVYSLIVGGIAGKITVRGPLRSLYAYVVLVAFLISEREVTMELVRQARAAPPIEAAVAVGSLLYLLFIPLVVALIEVILAFRNERPLAPLL